jgi:hypothetical protein
MTGLYGVRPDVEFVQLVTLVENFGARPDSTRQEERAGA